MISPAFRKLRDELIDLLAAYRHDNTRRLYLLVGPHESGKTWVADALLDEVRGARMHANEVGIDQSLAAIGRLPPSVALIEGVDRTVSARPLVNALAKVPDGVIVIATAQREEWVPTSIRPSFTVVRAT